MYIPKHFEIEGNDRALEFIKGNAFGQLVSVVDGRLFSSHVPFYHEHERKSLVCHLAKNNPQWKDIKEQEVLITFLGPHDYISPSWYESPGVPTWNYQAVHVYGSAYVIEEENRLKEIIEVLTAKYESIMEDPWQPKYEGYLLNSIVGIEISINEIQCKYKLSQNRSQQDRLRVIEQLKNRGSIQLAEAMKIEL